jgi:hypothetical protein
VDREREMLVYICLYNAAEILTIPETRVVKQACLDDVCIMPKGDDQAFLQKLLQTPQIKSSRYFGALKQNNTSFVINHYAGSVQYTITDFCEKNKVM